MENMIQAAHQHLIDASPPSCSPTARRRCRTNQENEDQVETQDVKSDKMKLMDHMDSFPLVPLPVIPLLSILDLEKVELGLSELLNSLGSHESDEQLGRYATRQLTVVRSHLTQQRAQERVFQMLQGDLPVVLEFIGAPTLRKSSSVSATVKIRPKTQTESLLDVQNPKLPPRPSSGRVNGAFRAQSSSESRNLHWKSKNAVELARAMVQANATTKTVTSSTSFVILAGENGLRKRRRSRAPPKRTPEQETQHQAQKLERERENRRQAAYQRLLARRELQEKRKQEHKKQKEEVPCGNDVCEESSEKTNDARESESDASDVSNCSESDEANEKAILALEVQIEPLIDDETKSEQSESEVEDGSNSNDELRSENLNFEIENQFLLCKFSDNSEILEDSVKKVQDDETLRQHEDDIKVANGVEIEQTQEEAISLDLQHFIASRAAAKLKQLQAEKKAQDIASPRLKFVPTVVSRTTEQSPIRSPSLRPEIELCSVREILPSTQIFLKGKNDDTSENLSPDLQTTDEKQSSWIDEVRQSVGKSRNDSPNDCKMLTLPRSPVAECKEYRSFFSNFHCILTSVFEQNRGFISSSSSSSLYHRPVGANGEHTMKLQQKLYESWQSIMQDYATVFGPKIVAPEGLIPMAARKPWAPNYRINSTARKEVSEIVTQALQRLNSDWEEHPSGLGLKTTWNLLWTWSKPRVERQTLLAWQKVNHFQHAKALTRKDCLKKHIGKYLAAGGRLRQAFDIIPPTFLLPKEYVAFVQAFQERSERLRQCGFLEGKNIWIMKPVALSRGRGISLVNDLSQVIYGEQVVIQEYIAAPRLLDGFKFDLRLYVLVTSFNPLEAFLYDEGFVRLCTKPYQDSDLSNIFVHLTNSSIQKDNEDAITGSFNPIASAIKEDNTEPPQTDTRGTKTTLANLWRRLEAEGVDVELVRRNIEEVVLKALLCGEDQIPFQVNSFDLLGYDILLDADLRPWLIEINSSPSMARDNDLDYQIKDAMMRDTLAVVDPLQFDRAKLAEVIARRQQESENEKRRPHVHTRHPRETEELAARQLNEDLTGILRGRVPRNYGEIPESIGSYKRLCPHTTIYNQLMKLKRSCLRGGDRKPS